MPDENMDQVEITARLRRLSESLAWFPMAFAPREEFHYIAALPKDDADSEPVIVYWDGDGWCLPEGALYQDDYFAGWSPLPRTT